MSAPSTKGNVLAIRGGAIGDFVLTLPSLKALRDAFPGTPLDLLATPSVAPLGIAAGIAREVFSLGDPDLAQFFVPNHPSPPPRWKERFSQYSIIVSWIYDPDNHFHENIKRCGVETVLRGIHKVDDHLQVHATKQLSSCLEKLAIFGDPPSFSFPSAVQRSAADTPSSKIAIHPGSGSPSKNWGYENWAAIAEDLWKNSEPSAPLSILHGEAEEETIDQFFQLLRERSVPWESVRRSLADLPDFLSSCRLFLGHDSGISHLAAACRVPCGLIFGPTDPAIWSPQYPHVRTWRAPSGSLLQVSREEVLTGARQLLTKR